MNILNKRKTEGFTIIEVVLVLAIAGLIFLIVFLALPALQRSQRDTQRKNDVSRMMSQLTQYQSNHQGNLPSGTGSGAWDASFVNAYLTNTGQTFNDPQSGSAYTVDVKGSTIPSTAVSGTTGNIFIYTNAKCDGSTASGMSTGSGSRSVAALMFLEQGGSLCQNN
jgi:prepilin-type N-terminal cleavage/methylation domain-containing protein